MWFPWTQVQQWHLFFSLGDKPLSVILDCYHRLILVLISLWLTTLSALEDKVIHVHRHSPSCFAPFNTCCHEPCFAAVPFLHWFLRGLKSKSCFFGESSKQALTILARSMERALAMHLSWLQSTTKCNACTVLGVYSEQHSSGFLLKSYNLGFFCFLFFPHCVNQINLPCSLQQINTHIFPVACYRLQNWVCFRQREEKLGKQVLSWQKELAWFVVYGPRYNTNQVLCVSVLWRIFWWAMSQPGSFQGKVFAVLPSCPSDAVLQPAVEVQTGEHLPWQGMAERVSVCP